MSIAGQESEWLEMSQRDRDRLKVLHGVIRKERLQKEAARLLRLSVRQVRRLVGRLKESGDRGLIHRLRGRPGNRRLPDWNRLRQLKADDNPASSSLQCAWQPPH